MLPSRSNNSLIGLAAAKRPLPHASAFVEIGVDFFHFKNMRQALLAN